MLKIIKIISKKRTFIFICINNWCYCVCIKTWCVFVCICMYCIKLIINTIVYVVNFRMYSFMLHLYCICIELIINAIVCAVKLGSLLVYANLDEKSTHLLLGHIHDFLKWVVLNYYFYYKMFSILLHSIF